MKKPELFSTSYMPKALVIGVQAPYNKTKYIETYFEEFQNLVQTRGIKEYEFLSVKLRDIDNKYFFTKGKLFEIKETVKQLDNIDVVIVSEQLSPQQERNLKDFLEVSVADRTDVILSIFEEAATSAEGKTQVEIARLEFEKTRLAGKGVHLAQQAGMIGVRGGPGETLKEKTTRYIDQNITKLKRKLKQLTQVRETQRKKRLANKVPHIALVGYTNAGKSTVLNNLTNSDVLAEDKLFATLDTTTRQLFINKEKVGVISDTVGFIQQLPHQLIEAFKSTLSELHYADLLLHVIDISDPNWQTHITVVINTLKELEISADMLFVFNKADKLTEEELEERLRSFGLFAPYVVTAANDKEQLQTLRDYLQTWKEKREAKK